MTLNDLGAALRRFWVLAAGIFALVVLIGALVALLPAKQYRSTVTVLVQPQSKDLLAVSSASEFLTPPVLERAGSDQFTANVRAQLPADKKNVNLSLSAENQAGTGIVFVRADSTDPAIAEQAAKLAADQLLANPVSSAVSLSILNPATPAESIAGTRRAVILLGSIVLAAIAAVLAAVAASSLRPRSSSAAFVMERFGLPVLGEIPAGGRLPLTTEALFNGSGPAEVMEASEKLAVNVEIMAGDNPTLAVTSWSQGEGKTLITAQLAWALASLGHNVTAVDCDLRKPALHTALGVDSRRGVVNLGGDGAVRGIRQRTPLASLDVIAAGKVEDKHPAEIIGPALERIVTDLGRRTLLLDTPPLFGAETAIIASSVDAVILVADARKTQPADLRDALRDLKLADAKVLGVVLNRARQAPRRRGSSRYYAATGRSRARA